MGSHMFAQVTRLCRRPVRRRANTVAQTHGRWRHTRAIPWHFRGRALDLAWTTPKCVRREVRVDSSKSFLGEKEGSICVRFADVVRTARRAHSIAISWRRSRRSLILIEMLRDRHGRGTSRWQPVRRKGFTRACRLDVVVSNRLSLGDDVDAAL